jgi:hyperosmotically inducible protein
VSDSWITTKVKAKVIGEDLLEGSNVRVHTDRDGVVTLSGTVRSEAGRKRAVDLTKATDGVRKVNDELKIEAR